MTYVRKAAARFACITCILAACTSNESSSQGGGGGGGGGGGAGARDAGADADAARAAEDATAIDAPVDAADAANEDAAPTIDAHADADADAGSQCNALAQRGELAWMAEQVGSRSAIDFTGGTIADGVYVLTGAVHYVEVGVTGTLTPVGRETIRIANGTLDEVQDFPAGDEHRFTAALVAVGTLLRMTTSCVWASMPGLRFPELGDWAPLEHETTAFQATPTDLTVWTPRGNHESVVRTYVKIE